MKILIKILLSSTVLLFSSFINISFADDTVKFKLKINPNQQKVEVKIDGDEHKQIQIRAEYVKLNPATNNHHIKVTITNNSGQILYHQLALIDKVEHSEVKYPDSTTDYTLNKGERPFTPTQLPYYNYGNIQTNQATPREWYLSNTGKEEIEVEGYIISKEIAVVLDPKIAAANPGVAATLTAYLTALRDNDLDGVLSTIAGSNLYSSKDLHKKIKNAYLKNNGVLLKIAFGYSKIKAVSIKGDIATFEFLWDDPNDGSLDNLDIVLLANFGSPHGWLLIEY